MLIKRRVLFLLIGILVLSVTFAGCYDLGDATENEEEYRETYPVIRVIDGASGVSYYTMGDFYNDEAVNDFKSPMSEEDRKEYCYILIRVEKKVSVGEVALYFDSAEADTLRVTFFVLDEGELPTKIYAGEGGAYPEEECDEPSEDRALSRASVALPGVPDKWKAVYLKSWGMGNETSKRYDIESGQFLAIRLDNNCYDPAKKELDAAEKTAASASERYERALSEWQALNNSIESTQEQKDAAMTALTLALREKNLADRDLEAARKKYEREKFPYKKMSVRITAILINAE